MRIVRIDEKAGFPIANHVRHPAPVRSHHRHTGRHRLFDPHRRILFQGHQGKYTCRRQFLANLFGIDPAEKGHVPPQAVLLNPLTHLPDVGLVVERSGKAKFTIGPTGNEFRHRIDQGQRVLARRDYGRSEHRCLPFRPDNVEAPL